MDQGLLLVVAIAALVALVAAWTTREVVGALRRRRDPESTSPFAAAAAELVPVLLQPLTRFVKNLGQKNTTIDSIIGPEGDVALLFSDIQDSTALNHEIGDDAWVRLIGAHDDVVARTVGRHGGAVVKTQGDGFMAAFPDAAAAVSAALELGPGLAESEAIDVDLPLRIGIHAGRVISTKSDLFGTNVAMAARVADRAPAGAVLVTDAVRDELEGSDGLAFRERRTGLISRGERVKGLPGRHRFHLVEGSPDGSG